MTATMMAAGATSVVPFWEELQARAEAALPPLVAGALILAVGTLVGWLARRLVMRAVARRPGRWPLDGFGIRAGLPGWDRGVIAGQAVQWFIVFCSSIIALYAVDPRLASRLAEQVLLYLPRLATGLVIAAGAVLLSKFAGRSVLIGAVNHEIRPARLLAAITRAAVLIIGIAIALEHAGIGQRTVLVAFSILFGGLTLAASIAVGLALQEPLRRWIAEQQSARTKSPSDEETLHHV
jgi:hypothetical protein